MADEILDELEVDVEEAPAEPEIEVVADKPKPAATSDDELAALKASLAAKSAEVAERDRQIAEAAAQVAQAEQQRNQAIQQRFGAQDAAVANALVSATNEAKQLKAEYQRALEEGKFDVAADINDRIADARLRIREAEGQKKWLDNAKVQFAHQIEADAQARERLEQQPGPSAKAKAWIDAHPRFNSDAAYRYKALAAHEEAIASGYALDSDDYFAHINGALGEGDGDAVEPTPQPRPAPKPTRTTMTPGPSRSGGGNGGGNPAVRRISLSAQERDMADATMGHIADPAERYKRYAVNRERMKTDKPLQVAG